MKQAFCTITTKSHLAQTVAMLRSIAAFGAWHFNVLVVDGEASLPNDLDGSTLEVSGPDRWKATEQGARLYKKYKGDKLRWALKPVLIAGLLRDGFDQVIYLDNDLFFYSDPSFLFDEMGEGVLLCPHWRIKDPKQSKDWFLVNFKDGMYNAGLVGAGLHGLEAMDWWADACYFACEQSPKKGLWDDQKYLDLIPAEFSDVHILQHRGVNLAYWNVHNIGTALSKWPLVCVHYTKELIKLIEKGQVPELAEQLKQYQSAQEVQV